MKYSSVLSLIGGCYLSYRARKFSTICFAADKQWDYDWDFMDTETFFNDLHFGESRWQDLSPVEKAEWNRSLEMVDKEIILACQPHMTVDTSRKLHIPSKGHRQLAHQIEALQKSYCEVIRNQIHVPFSVYDQYKDHFHDVTHEELLNPAIPLADSPPVQFKPYSRDQSIMKTSEDRFVESIQVEAAFRKFFKRFDVRKDKPGPTIVVAAPATISYFVCRALQLPPEAWPRISIRHGSITRLMIDTRGRVSVSGLGEIGHFKASRR